MKRTRVIVAMTVLSACLVGAATRIVLAQQNAEPPVPAAPAPAPLPGGELPAPELPVPELPEPTAPTPPAPLPAPPAPLPAPPVPGEPAEPMNLPELPPEPSEPASLPPPAALTPTPPQLPAEPEPLPAPPPPPAPEIVQSKLDGNIPESAFDSVSFGGRQEPAVSIEWVGPAMAKVGQPVTYQIMAKNISSATVHNVAVRYPVTGGVQVQASEPRAMNEGDALRWELGTLQPNQEKRIDVVLVPETKGAFNCAAQVSFTGVSTIRMTVREPKLVIKAAGPEKIVLGDPATVTLTVSNPGDGSADHVKVKATLPEGLEHKRGKVIEVELGNLGPKESRTVQLVCGTRQGGVQKCEAIATAEGNLTTADAALMEVVLPRIELSVTGPKVRYLDRPAQYVFKVTNAGTAPASNVVITDQVPPGFRFQTASSGGRHDFSLRTVSWFLGDLPPGQSREVSLTVLCSTPGTHLQKAVAQATREQRAETEIATSVEGLSALQMELLDVADPVEVGSDTCYEIRVLNTGSKTETNLELVCTVPDKMEFRGGKCNAGCRYRVEGRDVIFEPLPKLAPRADAIYRVTVRGLASGDMRFRARIKADGLSEPVMREESTKVYGDDVTDTAPPRVPGQ